MYALSCNDLVILGASAGGIETLRAWQAGCPRVLRTDRDRAAHVTAIARCAARNPDGIRSAGRVEAGQRRAAPTRLHYGAPPDFHLLIEPGRASPRQGAAREPVSAGDRFARSAAQVHGPVIIRSRQEGALLRKALGGHADTVHRRGGTQLTSRSGALMRLALRHVVTSTVEGGREPAGSSARDS